MDTANNSFVIRGEVFSPLDLGQNHPASVLVLDDIDVLPPFVDLRQSAGVSSKVEQENLPPGISHHTAMDVCGKNCELVLWLHSITLLEYFIKPVELVHSSFRFCYSLIVYYHVQMSLCI